MLLAEVHGKRCHAVEGNEDFLTSAVFGHLRYVDRADFWAAVFRRAHTVCGAESSLLNEILAEGVQITGDCEVKFRFWPYAEGYGEPDLLMWLRCGSSRPLVLIIEVKLYAEKSSSGPQDDQLCRYFRLLKDKAALSSLMGENVLEATTALVYLTERYSGAEVLESTDLLSKEDAAARIFPLQWQDLTEAIQEINPDRDSILGEVLRFLERRQYEHFRGFHEVDGSLLPGSGHYYETAYFGEIASTLKSAEEGAGRFYAD